MNEQQSNDLNADITPITGPKAKALGVEYGKLMIAEPLSEEQEARMIEILDLAITHDEVDFWVAHFTCSQGMETGLLSKSAQTNFENQKAMLREHLGQANLPPIRRQTSISVEAKLNSQLRQRAMDFIYAAAHNTNEQNLRN
jgi:hypothetical protein